METRLRFEIQRQPDSFTCGPTCLHAVYKFFNEPFTLAEVIDRTPRLQDGGTLGVMLACDALRHGYEACIYTYNLQVFDPTWFEISDVDLNLKLKKQYEVRGDKGKLRDASRAYIQYLELGGRIRLEDLTSSLIRRYLRRNLPILTGLSATYLYRSAREWGPRFEPDDLRGSPAGHFVVLCGYDPDRREVCVADPLAPNPVSETHIYSVDMSRVINAILLGIVTDDANLLILRPKGGRS
jgi:hypothetical protein